MLEQPARLIVVGMVQDSEGRYLLCKMPADRGVFPGEWGLTGGGVEPGETLEAALRREVREEVGLELDEIQPLFFSDGTYVKSFAGGERRTIYMVFLLFRCVAAAGEVRLNPEFESAAWVSASDVPATWTPEALSLPGPVRAPSGRRSPTLHPICEVDREE